MKINKNGATIWARSTIESAVFFNKPHVWFKIWFFLVNEVNHTDNKHFKRGSNFTTYDEIKYHTKATKNQIDSFMRWTKKQLMITTQKTTRGMIVFIINYDKYQKLNNYKTDTETDIKTETEPKQNRNRTDTINKNEKNVKNVYSKENPKNSPYKDFDKFQLNDKSIAMVRWGKWTDVKNANVKIERSHYKELPRL